MAKICAINLLPIGPHNANIHNGDKLLISTEREYASAAKWIGHSCDENVSLSQVCATQFCCFFRGEESC